MHTTPRICVVIPVYNHERTVAQVAQQAQAWFPAIVVDDGSTDNSAGVLNQQSGLTVLRLGINQGKGAALRAGFAKARELGFSHAITIDADGQHSTEALGTFADHCRQHPDALIVGVRDLRAAGAPKRRRLSNEMSNFCFRLETRQHLADTQCGYRCYPLTMIDPLIVSSGRYAYELEVLVKAAWAGIPLRACAVAADYAAATSQLSHFHPWHDLAQVAWLHLRLCVHALVRGVSLA